MSSVYDLCSCKSGKKFKFCCYGAVKNYATADSSIIAQWPLQVCSIRKNWYEVGITHVIIARKLPQGNFVLAAYLVDLWALGIKDVLFEKNIDEQELKLFLFSVSYSGGALEPLAYENARSIVLGSIKYAAALGFSPHKDWQDAKCLIEPDRSFDDSIQFGRDGKPFYCAGPNDTQYEEIIKTISKAG